MGIFDVFSSESYEKYEKKGDRFFDSNDFGSAKLEYEEALSRLEQGFLGRPIDRESNLYRVFLDPQRLKDVRAIEEAFHFAMTS